MFWTTHLSSAPLREATRAILLGFAYFLTACISARYTRFEGGVALIWVANALLFADLRYRPDRLVIPRLVACALGGIVATSYFGLGPRAAVPLGMINIGEAVGGVMLMQRLRPVPGNLSSLSEIGTLILVAGITLPACTAFLAALIAHDVAGVPYWSNWLNWFAAHSLGALTVVPFLNLVLNGELTGWARQARRSEWFEGVLHLATVMITSAGVFAQDQLPLLFLPFAPMMLAVFRLGRLGAAASLLVITVTATAYTLAGDGPVGLIGAGAGVKAQFLQFYLVVLMLVVLPAAAELKRRKKLYSMLQQSSALYKVIADRTGDIILALKVDGTIDYASPALRTLGGYEPSVWHGRKAREIIFSDDVERVSDAHAQAVTNPDQTFMVEFRARRASGELGWFESHGRAIVDDGGRVTGTVNIIREVSIRKAKELDLVRAAETDPLTGLANRRAFGAAFEITARSSTEGNVCACLALFDLDHFKRINDLYGHDAGDRVIQRFAETIKNTVRETDVVARIGGEEFAALLIGADIDQAAQICDRIVIQFAKEDFQFSDERTIHVTVSAGLANIAPTCRSLDDTMKAADVALYHAKEAGRDKLAIAA